MAGAAATVWARLRLDMSNFSSNLGRASRDLRRFAAQQSRDLRYHVGYERANKAIKSMNRSLRDTANITRGIIISQAFYAAIGAIREATSALWEFNKQLDYANITYTALFGDATLASDFMSVLQEHAIETIFDYQDLTDMAKKLLAYGIDYENLMFIMGGLTNLGAMTGDAAALDRVALAIGQIYTRGKLTAEEMRQLANAYVPIAEIIQNAFNLSPEDMGRVGDLNLPAEQVINAIVDYANEKFGAVGDAAMMTITGLEAKIVDTLKVVGSEMIAPLTTAYKSFLVYISEGLNNIREAFNTGGIGGVFEYLVPDENKQQLIRQFLANVKNLFSAIASAVAVAAQWFGQFAYVFMNVFNVVAPIVTGLINIISGLTRAFLESQAGATILRGALVGAAAAFILLRVQALGALVITAVTKAVVVLAKALVALATLIARHPIISLIAMLGVALVGVSTASGKADNALTRFFDTISGAGGGASSDDIFQTVDKEIQDGSEALDQFNNRLDEGIAGAEELEDAISGAGGAAKKTKAGLLSFDEVFKLNEQNKDGGGAGGGLLSDIEGIMDGLDSLGGGLSDLLIPEIPDFEDYFSTFSDSLFGGLSEKVLNTAKDVGIATLIGGAIGALIGLAFGQPILGAKIGMAVGGIGALIADAIGLDIENMVTMGTGAVAGISIALSKMFTPAMAIKGGIIGTAVGLLAGAVANLLWDTLDEKFENADADTARVGQTIGSTIGTVIGFAFGGPVGAWIGSVIGTFVGGFIGLFWEPIKEYFDPENNDLTRFMVETAKQLASWCTETIGVFSTWVSETKRILGPWFDDTKKRFSKWWNETTHGFSTWWSSTFEGLSTWWNDTVNLFSDWDNITGETLGNWWEETKSGFLGWVEETWDSLTGWLSDTTGGFLSWRENNTKVFGEWATMTGGTVGKWIIDTVKGFEQWKLDAWRPIGQWITDAAVSFGSWSTETWQTIWQWKEDSVLKFQEFREEGLTIIKGFGISILRSIGADLASFFAEVDKWLDDIAEEWFGGWDGIGKDFGEWWRDFGCDMGVWLETYVWMPIKEFFNLDKFWQRIRTLLDKIKNKLNLWWQGVGNIFSGGEVNVTGPTSSPSNGATRLSGHASGGIFNREHIARFAEGNKAEAIIPLENAGAMQPFVDAVSNGIVGHLAPIVANVGSSGSSSNGLPPMYVGTLIADDRGLKQLYRKFEIIKVQEDARRGNPIEVF